MVKFIEEKNNNLYQCEECKLKCEKEEIAKRCEAWCKETKSCNLEIIQYAVKDDLMHSS